MKKRNTIGKTTVVLLLLFAVTFPLAAGGSADQSTAADISFNPTGYPIVDEKITLDFLVQKWPNHGDYFEMESVLHMEELTNVHINWQIIPYQSVREKISLLFASNELPDAIFGGGLNKTDEVMYGGLGQLIPLNDLIDQYGENMKNVFERVPEVRKNITAPDGNIYSFFLYEHRPHMRVAAKWTINHTWLENLGLEVPETTEEFYAVLKAFKEQDANGNGDPNDEIPLWIREGYFHYLFAPWGVGGKFHIENNQLSIGYMHPGYKEGLRYYNRLYEEGLLNNEVFTQPHSYFASMERPSDPSILGAYAEAHPQNWDSFSTISPLAGPAGIKMHSDRGFLVHNRGAITSACEYPEVAFRVFDYVYSPAGGIDFNLGRQGLNWEYNANGLVEMLPTPEGMTYGEFRNSTSPGGNSPGVSRLTGYNETVLDQHEKKMNDIFVEQYEPNLLPASPEFLYLTQEQSDTATALEATIDSYQEEMRAKFISGQVSIDDGWDEYIETLKKMGVEELIGIYKDAYQTFLKN